MRTRKVPEAQYKKCAALLHTLLLYYIHTVLLLYYTPAMGKREASCAACRWSVVAVTRPLNLDCRCTCSRILARKYSTTAVISALRVL